MGDTTITEPNIYYPDQTIANEAAGWAGAVDQGKKKPSQQDAIGQFSPGDYGYSDPVKGYLFVVADGVGSRAQSQEASHIAVEEILSEHREKVDHNTDLQKQAIRSIRSANQKINDRKKALKAQDPAGGSNMATTCVCLAIRDGEATVAWVGDSRAYCLRAGRLLRWTKDHSWSEEEGLELMNAGGLSKEELRAHPKRHIITRALGEEEKVEASVAVERVMGGDRLLLCTDGLWEMVSEERIKEELGRGGVALEDIAIELVAAANRGGGKDNISLYVVDVSTVLSTLKQMVDAPLQSGSDEDTEVMARIAAPITHRRPRGQDATIGAPVGFEEDEDEDDDDAYPEADVAGPAGSLPHTLDNTSTGLEVPGGRVTSGPAPGFDRPLSPDSVNPHGLRSTPEAPPLNAGSTMTTANLSDIDEAPPSPGVAGNDRWSERTDDRSFTRADNPVGTPGVPPNIVGKSVSSDIWDRPPDALPPTVVRTAAISAPIPGASATPSHTTINGPGSAGGGATVTHADAERPNTALRGGILGAMGGGILLLLVLLFLIPGELPLFGVASAPTATPTPSPTRTSIPTNTAMPTNTTTPTATGTSTPKPTFTPTHTATPPPTNTPGVTNTPTSLATPQTTGTPSNGPKPTNTNVPITPKAAISTPTPPGRPGRTTRP